MSSTRSALYVASTVALIFGFLLAATTAAPEIRNLLSGLLTWLNKP